MRTKLDFPIWSGAFVAAVTLLSTPLAAQTRITLPAGSVILVSTEQPIESATMKVGQTFETSVVGGVSVNGYALIPANSRVRGTVAYVQPATRERSGVMQVSFDRLTLPDGSSYQIAGRLTSTDSTERRQIEQRADPRVVLVGERGGLGAAIAGAGSSSSPAAGILAALGNMLSEGRNVTVPAGTQLAVQLERSLTLTGRGGLNAGDESTIYTATERIRAAQQALARRAYFRGTANGVLDNPTRRALFEFQLDNNITPTGNLDGRTASALGILGSTTNPGTGASMLSAREAAVMRRAAQALAARQRQDLGIGTDGTVNASATISDDDLELLFAFSAFADNASLYEQLVRTSGTTGAATLAGGALINTARRVDTAIRQTRTSAQVQNVWRSIRTQLTALDQSYR
jgi:peptidoglycan hydrolase-like protein with peptidoglycan-binding domain